MVYFLTHILINLNNVTCNEIGKSFEWAKPDFFKNYILIFV